MPPGALPVHAAWGVPVALAPSPDGHLYVAQQNGLTSWLVALLGRDGEVATGWPISVAGVRSCLGPAVAVDGSMRLVCTDRDGRLWAAAIGPDGRSQPGWPVAVAAANTGVESSAVAAVVAGQTLTVLLTRDQPATDGETIVGRERWVSRIDATGRLAEGAHVSDRLGSDVVRGRSVLSAEGVAVDVTYNLGGPDLLVQTSVLTALDLAGIRRGWPVIVAAQVSAPAIAQDGSVRVVVQGADPGTSRLLGFERDGRWFLESSTLPVPAPGDHEGGAMIPSLAAPVVTADGTAYVVSGGTSPLVYAVEAATALVPPPWPYRLDAGLAWITDGPPDAMGSGSDRTVPVAAPDGTLYLPLAAETGEGGRLVAVGPDGRLRPGWPRGLTRAGSVFREVEVGADGTVYALAVEPESDRQTSATIVAFDPVGTALYRRTVLEP